MFMHKVKKPHCCSDSLEVPSHVQGLHFIIDRNCEWKYGWEIWGMKQSQKAKVSAAIALACFYSGSQLVYVKSAKWRSGAGWGFMFLCVCVLWVCEHVCMLTTRDLFGSTHKSLQGNKWAVKEWCPPLVDDEALKLKIRLRDCEDFILFSVLYKSKQIIFWLWSVSQTKWICHFGFCKL